MSYELLSTIDSPPSGFSFCTEIKPRRIRKGIFALHTDSVASFDEKFGGILEKITGIVVTEEKEFFFSQRAPLLWHLGISSDQLPMLQTIVTSYLDLLAALQARYRDSENLRIQFERANIDMRNISDYFSIVHERTRSDLQKQNQWTITALTELVTFSAREMAQINVEEFPEKVVDLLLEACFAYTGAAVFRFDKAQEAWALLVQRGDTISLEELTPPAEDDTVRAEGSHLFAPFVIGEVPHCVVVSNSRPLYEFGDHECSFFKIFSEHVAASYDMKRLSSEVEERVVEISNIRMASHLIQGLRDETLLLKDVCVELHSALSLEAVNLARTAAATGTPSVVFSKGEEFTGWGELSRKAEIEEHDDWLVFSFPEEEAQGSGFLACRLSHSNPTFSNIQRRVLDDFFPQMTMVLNEKKFQIEAVTDPLTQLYNRRYIMRTLRERIARAKLDLVYGLSVCMIDLDHFKDVNDTWGHEAGDHVLKVIAEQILAVTRRSDVAGRYGGEEFIIIMDNDLRAAVKVAERLRRSIGELDIRSEGVKLRMTISAGIASLSPEIDDAPGLVQKADKNLYEAKRNGRNRICPSEEK